MKPQVMDIYRLALDVAQRPSEQAGDLEGRPLCMRIAQNPGLRGFTHFLRIHPHRPGEVGASNPVKHCA